MNCEIDLKIPRRRKRFNDDEKCRVCGDNSIGLNFGVHTCSPCKAFFRRNAVKLGTYEYQCRNDGNCSMSIETRRRCNCCRLAKCFRAGMNRNAILTDEQRLERNQLIEFNRQKRAEGNQDEQEKLQITIPSDRLSTSSAPPLSPNDYDLLNNVNCAHEQTCTPLTYEEHLNMSMDEQLTLEEFLNASANIYIGLINYFKLIPEFNQLPVNNRLSLIKRNLNQISRIQSIFCMKIITPNLDDDSLLSSYLFPKDLYFELRRTAIALTPFVYDSMLIKLYIIVLMLSTHLNVQYDKHTKEILDEDAIRTTFDIQNIYLDLFWRYILSRSDDEQQAVQMFVALIGRTLDDQLVQSKMNEFIHSNLANHSQSLEPIIRAIWISK